jgi:hypothetical protein
MPPVVSFQKIDPDLGAVTIGAELTRLSGPGSFLGVIDVVACVALMWHELGANCYDVEL